MWVDHNGHTIKTRGAEDINHCPFRIAIVSTGLIFHDSDERSFLLERRFGTVVLDEAHKARRRGGLGERKEEPNNLLDFMLRIGPRTRHLLLGTATPIQTNVSELWDLMQILNEGAEFVFGRHPFSNWADWQKALPLVKGDQTPVDEREAWEWLRNPLPPGDEDPTFAALRLQLGIPEQSFFTDKGFGSLGIFRAASSIADAGGGLLQGSQSNHPSHCPAPSRDTGRGGSAGKGRCECPPQPDKPPRCLLRCWV